MKNFVLNVPGSRYLNDWIAFSSYIVNNVHYYQGEVCTFNFNRVRFLETDDIVVLACMMEYLLIHNVNINYTGTNQRVIQHLQNINFDMFCNKHFDRFNIYECNNNSSVPLWKINPELINQYAEKITNSIKHRCYTKKLDYTPLHVSLMEVFNNVFDHSSSRVGGFIMGQYYPKTNQFSFSVCDFGVGIPYRINEFRVKSQKLDPLTDHMAILEATKLGVSSKTTKRNKGFGLNNLYDITESNKGSLRIVSYNGMFEKSHNNILIVKPLHLNLPGTLIRVDISLDSLEEIDFTDSLHDFDF